jgi:parallel beta-helix repeat protein
MFLPAPSPMTLDEARKILGLGPDEDPHSHLAEFGAARERIAEMVRSAPNETLGDRYQQGLVEFDQALAAIRESLETPPEASVPPDKEEERPSPPRRTFGWFVWFLVFLIGAAGGGFLYFKTEEDKETKRQLRLAFLERLGSEFIENRRWQDASAVFAEIETIAPGLEMAKMGRRSIEAGMSEEQNQFVGYWTGQAIAELEAGRLDEAETAARRVIEKFPAEKEPVAILKRIATARASQARDASLAAARKLLEEHQCDAAIAAARRILATSPDDGDAKTIVEEATAILEKQAADQAKAMSLLQQAIARDQGGFDQQAFDWLREAATLAPGNTEIAARLEKMASYTRTLRVPGDFATPAEALAAARDRDRIVLAEQTWKGPLVIDADVDLQGAGSAKTIIECPATEGSAITIGPDAKGARITGISFRHESFLMTGSDRFSAALVRGGGATFTDCHFSDASGHGLAVIEHGEAIANRCRFSGNGWNGAAAIGKGSKIEVRDSESIGNFEHGIETWDGAVATLVNNRCEGNSRNGIHTDNGESAATIEGNQLIANREFGLVLDSAGSGKISGNTARGNLLGGFVIRAAAAKIPVTGNQATLNEGPGIVLEKGLQPGSYADNTATQNKPTQIVTDADLAR